MSHHLASIFRTISHGVYIIAVSDQQRRNAFTASWVMQVSFKPLMIAFSINPEHYSYSILRQSKLCTINVLAKQQLAIAEHLGRSGAGDKMDYCQWAESASAVPYLPNALAYFECKVINYCEAGDHQIAVCEVVGAEHLNEGEPMLYRDTGNMDGSSDLFLDGFNK